ncbi:hypothetical protein [Rhizobium leguminosarum]|uniref:hypothetical protein n=1 Tax=Rhizobium leguminosarum TaxID=384 RepID=UPI002FEEE4AB
MPLEFEIAPELMPYVADATVRFRYLNPGIDVTISGATAVIAGNQAVNIRDLEQQFMFCLYRQKIYSETLPLRRTLLAGVTGR